MVFGIFCNADGSRLNLNWNDGQLNCDNWNLDEERNDNVGVSALMMEKTKDIPTRSGCLALWARSDALQPLAQHASGGREFTGKLSVFSRINSFCFPEQCDKKLELIQFAT